LDGPTSGDTLCQREECNFLAQSPLWTLENSGLSYILMDSASFSDSNLDSPPATKPDPTTEMCQPEIRTAGLGAIRWVVIVIGIDLPFCVHENVQFM